MRKYLSFLEGMGLELKQLDEVTTKDFLVSYLCLRDKVLDCRSPQPLSPAPNQHIAPSFGDCGEVVFTESKISEMPACPREEQDLPGGDIFLAASAEPQAQLLYGKGFPLRTYQRQCGIVADRIQHPFIGNRIIGDSRPSRMHGYFPVLHRLMDRTSPLLA